MVGRERGDARLESEAILGIERADRVGEGERFEVVGDHAVCSRRTRRLTKPCRARTWKPGWCHTPKRPARC